MLRRSLATGLVALLLWPAGAFAQAARAGVVTTLEGNVTARRVALPAPLPLKFKDDVFLQDTVTTGDKSLARLLLGGKAVVTVRERSVITITEVPGRSTLELESGKFALAVARERMRPGEEIQIRTPNAVAGVRGTVVVTEVTPGRVVTNFYVLRGTITVQPLDPGTQQQAGPSLAVGTLQAYTQAGTGPPRVAPVRPDQVQQIVTGLQPKGPKSGTAGEEQVKEQALETAVTLLRTLTGDVKLTTTPLPTSTFATPTTNVIIPPFVDACSSTAGCTTQLSSLVTALDGAVSFLGDFISTSTLPLFTIAHAKFVTATSFINLAKGGNISLAGPLAQFTDSEVFATGSLLDIEGGKLKSTSPSALLALDPTVIVATQSLILMNGGSVTLNGPLLTDTHGTITTGGSFLDMSNGAALTATKAACQSTPSFSSTARS